MGITLGWSLMPYLNVIKWAGRALKKILDKYISF